MVPGYLQALFWDINLASFDPAEYPHYTIERVLEYGDQDAVIWLRQTFSEEQITEVVRNDRRLSPKSANFWALIFELPHDQVAALKVVS